MLCFEGYYFLLSVFVFVSGITEQGIGGTLLLSDCFA